MSLPIVDRYRDGATLLAYATQGLTPDQLRTRTAPGSWSPIELVVHVVDAELVYGDRLKRVLAESNPDLTAFDEHAWLDGLDAREMPLDDALALFLAHRNWLGHLLARRKDSDFARAGQHSQRGRQTAAEVVVAAVHHLDHHLKYLYGKRANLGVAIYPRFTTIPEG